MATRVSGPPALDEVLARAGALAGDLELRAVAAWKEAQPGGRALGVLPGWFPGEVARACGWLPVAVSGGGDRVDIVRGDAYYQSYLCHLPRSTVEMALGGFLDPLDGLVAPAICDVIRNFSGVWQMLHPEKLSIYFDFPQDLDPAVGGQFLRRELTRILSALAERGGRFPGPEELRAAIEGENWRRSAVRTLGNLRAEKPWLVPVSEAFLVVRAGAVLPAEEHAALLRDYVRAAEGSGRRPRDDVRVLLVGAFCEQPPIGLLRTLEQAGCVVVDDDLNFGTRALEADVPLDGDPLGNIARTWLEHGAPSSARFESDGSRAAALVATARSRRAQGVVFCAPSFCSPALLDRPSLERACDEAGIPHTSVQYVENTGQFQVVRELAGTFSDSIRLWS
ncbi:MAG: 2-hydroxyacyl-CoA dehydratase [Planctomycetales bacterium]|nr:2-hydroxyacyl-CoA dehydratase [Planctomycetales bacterium]